MPGEIYINDQLYQAVRLVSKTISYSPDYITRLARAKKIKAVQLGRRWYVSADSLSSYLTVQNQEQEIRQKHLQQVRLRERAEYALTQQIVSSQHGHRPSVMFGLVATSIVVVTGMLVGFVAQSNGLIMSSPSNAASLQETGYGEMAGLDVVVPTMLSVTFTDHSDVAIGTDRTISRPDALREQTWSLFEYE